jgi:hypothetical protein
MEVRMTQARFLARSPLVLAPALLLSATLAAHAADPSATTDPGFVPNSGQINRGTAPAVPSTKELPPIPSPEEARAALMAPEQGTISVGANSGAPSAPVTTGTAPAAPANPGPIGATLQTMPAKFSQRNDVLDRLPIMAWPLRLDQQQRQQIMQAVMADKSQAVPGAEKLLPAASLTDEQQKGLRPLPENLQSIPGLKGLSYLPAKDKVLLVRPDIAIVVDQISAS